MEFKLATDKKPAGDQPQAIEKLVKGIKNGETHQTLLGVTGSGKTYTAANVIQQIGKPALVIAHNKTLAAQLAQEYRDFFPENAVHFFVSYYDYYQPEAYMPTSDTYIEKEAQINEEIDRLRHASTQALLTRKDVIIVASVSCIYGLGAPAEYLKRHMKIERGFKTTRADMLRRLIDMYFERTNADLVPGHFRAVGNTIEIMPTNERVIYRLGFTGDSVTSITKIDAITRAIIEESETFFLFPAKHFVTPEHERKIAIEEIQQELEVQLAKFKSEGKLLEAERLRRRTQHDLALMREVGYCNGIENYSRHFDRRKSGEAPYTLLSYFPHKEDGTPDFITIIDESHVSIPQINGMYAGDRSRKDTLVEFGFRLPSAVDNRPLKFAEFEANIGQRIYTSATPGKYEYEKAAESGIGMVEQIIRPTGLVDPAIDIRPITEVGTYPGQIKDFIDEAEKVIKGGARVLTTTLTKKMAEDLSEFLTERGISTKYIHSDVDTIERIEILTDFRRGKFDCLVGVNLLREGLDLPEVELVAILDADKQGFLRSETALIQTIGRAARNVNGRVILYADEMTPALDKAIGETTRRRNRQLAYNKEHGITPKTIAKEIKSITDQMRTEHDETVDTLLKVDMDLFQKNPKGVLKEKKRQMDEAVAILDFETAAIIRDEIRILEASVTKKSKKKTTK
ncbi:excinuclease ABC subunit B [Candidatus Kaiserbacteria bacterium RIFCSPLOWO2_02_FULL_45_11b]|uniref:UvrABC system protein B n=1 Tax=Candidatus Kaiserbacteria bacterium RIFCSPLOWO2_12_FULL_45_26 TaxID=1798525 RepID=A0A1F6FGQ1_9BACT|nr:MAG: excinuclease ABC subunit B [Candidatus Kaiserbacteria bacterium RIFCSPLOWO2_01_FULL_45_25]OGG81451.1 MAG: excinuclease ABC subunit B [Candidatus Kaiserbacteria bacterium RIFCSPLOWO2_02_FULL_45_11b]OGG85039.1 MAG: excinuclease ABC subunit B [Candidatus Kaiserbacteria bacterium RIFCSPLOWO2_12_FULL_45_26]